MSGKSSTTATTIAASVGAAAICASLVGTAGAVALINADSPKTPQKVVNLGGAQTAAYAGTAPAAGAPAAPAADAGAPLAADPGAAAPAGAGDLPPALAAVPEAAAPAAAAPAAAAPAGDAPAAAAPGAAAPQAAPGAAAAPQQGPRRTRSPQSITEATAADLVITAQRPRKIDWEWQYAAWWNPRVPMQAKLDASYRGNDPKVKKVLQEVQASSTTYNFLSVRGSAVGATRYQGNRAWQDFRGSMAGFPVMNSYMAYIWDGGQWKFEWKEFLRKSCEMGQGCQNKDMGY